MAWGIAYKLTLSDIHPHEDVSWKTPGEGKVVVDAIQSRLTELYNSNDDAGDKKEETKPSTPSIIPTSESTAPRW